MSSYIGSATSALKKEGSVVGRVLSGIIEDKLYHQLLEKLTNMKFRNILIILFLVLLFGFGCTKKTTEPSDDCLSKLDFTKITFTDNNGNTLSVDPTDWTNDSAWCDQEYRLFSTSNLDLTGSDTSKLFTILFPNPLRDIGILVVTRPKLCPFKCVIVNRSFQVLDTFSIPNQTGNVLRSLNFSDSLKYKHGEYYRLYYAAHSTKFLFFFKGHGDFKIQ